MQLDPLKDEEMKTTRLTPLLRKGKLKMQIPICLYMYTLTVNDLVCALLGSDNDIAQQCYLRFNSSQKQQPWCNCIKLRNAMPMSIYSVVASLETLLSFFTTSLNASTINAFSEALLYSACTVT